MKKAQTATEYLIVLAVVIIIALIVVGVMGGFPNKETSAQKDAVGKQICSELNLTYGGSDSFMRDAIICKTNHSIVNENYNISKPEETLSVQVNWQAYNITGGKK